MSHIYLDQHSQDLFRLVLKGSTQVDETLAGGKGADKEIVVVVAEEQEAGSASARQGASNGRVRMTHAPGNHTQALKVVIDSEIDEDAEVKTDGNPA